MPPKRLEELLDSGSAIAVVGMAAHVPGATNIREYWDNLRNGVESIRPVSDEDLLERGVPAELLEDPNFVKVAAELGGMDHWDAGFWGFSPKDAAIMDPQHRHFLECAWEALEDAGHMPERFEGPIGVFAGSGANAYFWANVMTNAELVREVGFFLLRHTGNDKDFLSTRVSYELDLRGPSVNVQTACSTSLVALHLAGESLLTGECDMALAGGVTIDFPAGVGYVFKENEILSPDGHCRAFDADSAGTVFGSGAGIVVLRRLEDAVNDGDNIRAVILGSAVNNDGSGKVGYLAPSVDGQAKAIAEALTVSGVKPDEVTYIETHGTGTAVGDPIEVAALTEAFRTTGSEATGYCGIGSVKTNIGHLDTAAGVAGLIKAISALQHRELPPSLHFKAPNPQIDFDNSPFYVNASLKPWESTGPRRAGVSSLGVGGTNSFVIVEEAPERGPSSDGRPLKLIPLSGRSRRVLEAASADLSRYLEDNEHIGLDDAAYTLSVGRRGFKHRRIVVAGSTEELVDALVTGDEESVFTGEALDTPPPVSFLFAGGGAQFPGMGAGLYEDEPVYREVVDECLGHLEPELSKRVKAFLLGDTASLGEGEDLERPSLALPALFITQIAQSRLWMSWGIEPESMIGHSMGEYSAACLAGVLTMKDALSLVVVRGRLFEEVDEGGMLSVNLSEEQLKEHLPEGLSIAAANAPELMVASGPVDLIQQLEDDLVAKEIECRRIHISVAAHSAMLEPILDRFEAELRKFQFSPPQMRFASNLSGDWITEAEATDPLYWRAQLRNSVRFSDGIQGMLDGEPRILLEVGPGRTLATLARMNQTEGNEAETMTSMRHPDSEGSDLAFQLGVLGRLWARGVDVDWNAYFEGQTRHRVPLPTYPFERDQHWIAPGRGVPLQDGMEISGSAALAPAEDDALGDWFYAAAWDKSTLGPESEFEEFDGSLVVVHSGGQDVVLEALRSGGMDVVPVTWGPDYGFGGDSATLRRGSVEDVSALFAALDEADRTPEGILFLDLVGEGAPDGSVEDRGFFGYFGVVKALGEIDPEPGFKLVVATTKTVSVASEDPIEAWKTLVFGPVRVTPRELPSVSTRVVDFGAEADAAELGTLLLGELQSPVGDRIVAYRNGERLREKFEQIAPKGSADKAAVRDGGTYLITGGLGGLGLTFAAHMADQATINLVLIGRSGLPARDEWDAWLEGHSERDRTSGRIRAVRALEAKGATVQIEAVDIADTGDVAAMVGRVKERFGGVTGVLHSAGVLDDAPILAKTAEEAEAVLRPKVGGTVALDAALDGDDLDFFVVFSSRSATSGLPGQVDYTSANAFLDGWAQNARARGKNGYYAIEWDVWRDVGMAAELHAEMTGQNVEPPADPVAIDHPIFDFKQVEPEETTLYTARFAKGKTWILDEHKLLDGGPLIPGTGFLEIARAALELDGVGLPAVIQDVMFLAPFMVAEDGERELGVRIEHDERGASFSILGRANADEGWMEHAQGRAEKATAGEAPSVVLKKLRKGLKKKTEVNSRPENPHLDFGRHWFNLVRIEQGSGEALLTLELPAEYHAELNDFALHPALLDVATAGAPSLIDDYNAEGSFYIPASYADIHVRAPLQAQMFSHVTVAEQADGMVVFNVSIMDTEGRELVHVEEFVMLRVDENAQLGTQSAPAPSDELKFEASGDGIEGIDDGIGPEDGVLALDRIVSSNGSMPPVVVVMRRDLFEVMEALDSGAMGGADAPPPVDVQPLVDVLLDHPAIADGTAVAHGYGAGDVRIVAFIVYDPTQPSTVSAVRRHLRENLPAELVPQNFVEMTEIPRTKKGKVDKPALPDPFAPKDDYVAPKTPTEEIIADIWKRLMGLSRVSIYDNFLDAGGHSLLGIRALLQIEKRTGVRLHPNQLTLQTLEQLAAEVDRNSDNGTGDAEAPDESGGGLQGRIQSAFKQFVGGK